MELKEESGGKLVGKRFIDETSALQGSQPTQSSLVVLH